MFYFNSKRPRVSLWALSLISLCALQANAAPHTDANGNVGYDTLAECVAAIDAGNAKFYRPYTNHPPLKRFGETDVRSTTLRALTIADYSKGSCDIGTGRANGRDGVSQPLIGKFVPYAPDMPVNAYFDASGTLVRASMEQCDNNFSGAFPRPLGTPVSNTECFATVQIPARFETQTERVVKIPETTRMEVIPGTFKTISEQVLVRPEIKKQITIPATYKTVQETVVVQPATEREEPIAPTYKMVSEQVLVKPESKRVLVNPATYKTVTEQVMVHPERKGLRTIPAVFKDVEETVPDRPATTRAVVTPASYQTVTEQVMVEPESLTYLPLELPLKTLHEEVVLRQASSRFEVTPSSFKTVQERIEVKPASKRIVSVPAVFETITERVKIAEAHQEWKRGRAWIGVALDVRPVRGFVIGSDNRASDGNRVEIPAAADGSKALLETRILTSDNNNLDDDVLCLVEVPAQYQMLTRQVLKTPATTREEDVPAEFATITRRVVDREAGSQEVAIAQKTQTVTRQVIDVERLQKQGYQFDALGDIVATPNGERVLRASTLTPSSEGSVTPSSGAASGQEAYVREVKTPAQFATVSRQVLEQAASVSTITVPGSTRVVRSRVEVSPARTEEIILAPAVFETVAKQVIDTPESTHEITVPATYRTIERQVIDTPASVRRIPVPAETQVISRRVIDQAASVREEIIPAVYTTATRQVVDLAPQLRAIEVPAVYEELPFQVKVTDARLERRSILCETNATPTKIMEIQRALLASGHNPGRIDGVIRANTMRAVNSYQTAKGLPVDGFLNIETVKALGVSPF